MTCILPQIFWYSSANIHQYWQILQTLKPGEDKYPSPSERGVGMCLLQKFTSRRKVRSCKGAEPKWKQILSYRCLEKVLQQSLYEHSFVPGPLASPCLLFWGWWLKSGCPAIRWFPSYYSVPGKAAAANEGLMFLICFTMQKSFCWDSSSEDSICLFLQEIIWVSELMPRDWVLYLLLRRKLPFFLYSSSKAKSSLVFLLSHTEWWGNSCILQFNGDTTLH